MTILETVQFAPEGLPVTLTLPVEAIVTLEHTPST